MWPINYDDPRKLHMSIGIGLIVAAVILTFTNTLQQIDYSNKLINNVREDWMLIQQGNHTDRVEGLLYDQLKNFRNAQNEMLLIQNIRIINISILLYALGALSFSLGYFFYLKNYFKEQRKSSKLKK